MIYFVYTYHIAYVYFVTLYHPQVVGLVQSFYCRRKENFVAKLDVVTGHHYGIPAPGFLGNQWWRREMWAVFSRLRVILNFFFRISAERK